MIGHASLQITYDIYGGLINLHDPAMAQAMTRAMIALTPVPPTTTTAAVRPVTPTVPASAAPTVVFTSPATPAADAAMTPSPGTSRRPRPAVTTLAGRDRSGGGVGLEQNPQMRPRHDA
jgi:hypothetical protein